MEEPAEPRAAEQVVDAVVIGGGPAGEVAAGRLAEGGLEVALVERELVGGECSYYACMPSKALLRPGQVVAEARRVAGAAQAVDGPLDVGAVLARRDEIVHDLDDTAQLPWLEQRGIELVRGHGRLAGERLVEVGGRRLRARRAIVLATGSRAAIPPLPGLAEAAPWTNREVTTAKAVPGTLLILGGGVVGVEMASAYASLGARVTLVEAEERLIAGEEPWASELVCEGLRSQGVRVLLDTRAASVERERATGAVRLSLEGGEQVEAEELLVATGRRPLSDELGLETVGLAPGAHGYLEVGADLRPAGVDWLYAVGDLNGRALLTHMGKHQARNAADAILGRAPRPAPGGEVVPRVIFTEPQVAAAGHTTASAKAAGLRVREVKVSLQDNAGSSYIGHGAGGCAQIVVAEDDDVIVGATFVGVEVAESLHAATIAIAGRVPRAVLAQSVPCFPTRSEVWLALVG